MAITFSAHRYLEPVLAQGFLRIIRAILRPTIRVMDAAFGWRPERDGHLQRPDCQVTLHPVAACPTNDAPGMQIQDHSKIQPAFTRPDICDVTSPFLVWAVGCKVSIQQVGCNVEFVIAVPLSGAMPESW